jgi:HAD superfamily hydrolase (TIGR01490 family)
VKAGRPAAFFDVDHTLIAVNSGRKWVEYLWKKGRISIPAALRSLWWLAKYRLSVLDYDAVTEEVVRAYAGQKVADLEREVGAWFETEILPTVTVEGREKVRWHRERGDVTVMLTSGTRISTEPLRRCLEITHNVCTELEVVDGALTGRYRPPACYGEGKRARAEAFADEHGIDLAASTFYTDSYSDLPTLERVGHPQVVNPDPRLRRHAEARGWGWSTWRAP